MESTRSFLEKVFRNVHEIAAQTVERLGEDRATQFTLMSSDGLIIAMEFQLEYEQDELMNLVNVQLWALLKELKWLQVLFLAGNYPLVKSRLRYLWEAMYRAYFVETHKDAAVRRMGPDDKLKWIEAQKPRLDWATCIQPALVTLCPEAKPGSKLQQHYKALWEDLNQYVHPSEYLQSRLVDDSSLLVKDNFDQIWAEDTLHAGLQVADLLWLAALSSHQKVIDAVAQERLSLEYPLTRLLLQRRL